MHSFHKVLRFVAPLFPDASQGHVRVVKVSASEDSFVDVFEMICGVVDSHPESAQQSCNDTAMRTSVEEIEVMARKQLALSGHSFKRGFPGPGTCSTLCVSLVIISHLVLPRPYFVHKKSDEDQARV